MQQADVNSRLKNNDSGSSPRRLPVAWMLTREEGRLYTATACHTAHFCGCGMEEALAMVPTHYAVAQLRRGQWTNDGSSLSALTHAHAAKATFCGRVTPINLDLVAHLPYTPFNSHLPLLS